MTRKTTGTQAVKLDPAKYYQTPADVLDDHRLTQSEKLEILKAWEIDARELQVAEEENMGGGEPSLLAEVERAIAELRDERSA